MVQLLNPPLQFRFAISFGTGRCRSVEAFFFGAPFWHRFLTCLDLSTLSFDLEVYRLDLPPSLLISMLYLQESFVVISLVDDAVRLYTLCIHAGRRWSLILRFSNPFELAWLGGARSPWHPGDGNGGQNSESPFKIPWRDAVARQMYLWGVDGRHGLEGFLCSKDCDSVGCLVEADAVKADAAEADSEL